MKGFAHLIVGIETFQWPGLSVRLSVGWLACWLVERTTLRHPLVEFSTHCNVIYIEFWFKHEWIWWMILFLSYLWLWVYYICERVRVSRYCFLGKRGINLVCENDLSFFFPINHIWFFELKKFRFNIKKRKNLLSSF